MTLSPEEIQAAKIWMRGSGVPVTTVVNLADHIFDFLCLAEMVKLRMLERSANPEPTGR